MHSAPAFRLANEADIPFLHELSVEGLASTLDLERFAVCVRRIMSEDRLAIWVASVGDAGVGTFSIAIGPTHGARCRPLALVDDVIVTREARSRGIGRAMMEQAMDLARSAGCYKLMLSSNVEREAAHRFYESLGFARHGYSFEVELD